MNTFGSTNVPRAQMNQFSGPRRPSKPGANYFCTHCKVQGHSIDRCFQLQCFPPGFKGFKDKRIAAAITSFSQNSDDVSQVQSQVQNVMSPDVNSGSSHTITEAQYAQLVDLLNNASCDRQSDSSHALLAGNICLLSSSKSKWLLDSGATDHICPSLDQFVDYELVNSDASITIPDGSKIPVLHKGTVILNDQIILRTVLHVPDFRFHLISVTQLCKDLNCNLIFSDSKCFLQDHSQKRQLMLLGNMIYGLYSVQISPQVTGSTKATGLFSHFQTEVQLWHLRLGHLPFSQMKLVTPQLNISDCINTTICQVCPAARQCRKSFPHSSIKTTSPLELLHVDVWGPYRTKTYTNCTSFLTIVDDYTRFTWVHLFQRKSDVAEILEKFVSFAEKQFKHKVLCIRSDNALELT